MTALQAATEAHPKGQDTVKGANWRTQAACRTQDPELFFPLSKGALARQQEEEAIKVCKRCPVRQQCLRWALAHGAHDGVWGGLTEKERNDLKRFMNLNRR